MLEGSSPKLAPCYFLSQQLAEESAYRTELQMQLDSKESDIEQLRERLNDLQLRMDNSSVTSLQTDETDSNIAGKVSSSPPRTAGKRAPPAVCVRTQGQVDKEEPDEDAPSAGRHFVCWRHDQSAAKFSFHSLGCCC